MNIYLNTAESLFLNAQGSGIEDGKPELTVGGKEVFRFFLKSSTPSWGTAAARPAEWPADTSWAAIPGISAMLTVDNDYRKYLPGKLASEATEGSVAISVNVSGADDIPEKGILKILPGSGKEEYLFFESRQASGSNVTFNLGSALTSTIPQETTVQVQQEPLAQSFIDQEKSDWNNGELVFELLSDSFRLRREVESGNAANVNIAGIELLLYSTASDNTVQIHRAFLLDTATLRNVQGNPGFPAAVPDKLEDKIAELFASNADKFTPRVDPSTNTWVVNGEDTGVEATGKQGNPGKAGPPGEVVYFNNVITSLIDGMIVLPSSAFPVGIIPPSGVVYPAEKGYVTINSAGEWVIDPAPYLAYENMAEFSGIWNIYCAGKMNHEA